jgi:hypothetical protein
MHFNTKCPFQIIRTIKRMRVTTSTEEDATKITSPRSPLFLIVEEDR